MSNWLKSCITGLSSFLGAGASQTGSPLPKTQHLHLSLAQVKNRLVIVGDVHGCLDELKRLMEKVRYSPETTTVILVGDLVAKGPASAEVIRFVKSHKMISVRGNHEDNAMLAHYKAGTSKYSTRPDYNFVKSELTTEEIEFIKEFPLSVTIPELRLQIVHAGVDPGKKGYPIHHQDFADLIRIRCVDENGKTTKDDPSAKRKLWGPLYTGPPYIVFGHDAKRRLQVHPWARGIDTGCVYGGSLTALVVNDTRDLQNWMARAELVSVPAAKAYCERDSD